MSEQEDWETLCEAFGPVRAARILLGVVDNMEDVKSDTRPKAALLRYNADQRQFVGMKCSPKFFSGDRVTIKTINGLPWPQLLPCNGIYLDYSNGKHYVLNLDAQENDFRTVLILKEDDIEFRTVMDMDYEEKDAALNRFPRKLRIRK